MTTPTGAPDWLKTQPGGSAALVAAAYNSGAQTQVILGPYAVAAYRALAVTVKSTNNAQVFRFDFYGDSVGATQISHSFAVIPAGGSGTFTVPVVAPYFQVTITGFVSNVGQSGTITVGGHGSDTDYGAMRGVTVITDTNGTSVAAGATLTLTPSVVATGPASLSFGMPADPANWKVKITAVDQAAVVHFLFEVDGVAGKPDAAGTIFLPPWPLTISLINNGAAAHGFNFNLTVGG